MLNIRDKLIEHRFIVFLCLFSCSLYYILFASRAYVDFTIDIERRTHFKVYWAEKGEKFSESKSKKILINPKQKHYGFYLTDLRNVERLRIDPYQYKGDGTIQDFHIEQRGIDGIIHRTSNKFVETRSVKQLVDFKSENGKIFLHSNGKHPSFVLNLENRKTGLGLITESIRYLLICLVIVVVYTSSMKLSANQKHIPLLLTTVLLLVTVMAVISQKNTHPDEYVHVKASQYYQDNWIPPLIADPDIRDTYSRYGFSRLNSPEIAYFCMGKFQNILSILHIDNYWTLRFFNVCLFGIILFYTITNPGARPVAAILLISPQIWYVFSYCNSDAFAMFISFFVSCQLVIKDSLFNVFLHKKYDSKFIPEALILGVLLGCLLLLKKNYYPFIAFAGIYVALGIYMTKSKGTQILLLKRLVILLVIGLTIFGLRRGLDYYVNGIDRQEKIVKMSYETADPMFSSKTELTKQHMNLHMKEKGIPLERLVTKYKWLEKTFRTTFGVYGHFTVQASYTYYNDVRWVGVGFLVFFFGSIFFFGGLYRSFLAATGLMFSIGLICLSLYSSWNNDFQPQGRYLLPIVPILGVVYSQSLEYINKKIFTLFLLAMFFISMYSFVFVALLGIHKFQIM